MTLSLESKIKLIIKERKDLLNLGCKNEKILYKLTSEFYQAQVKEPMSMGDYACAVRIMFEEKK